MISLSFPRWRKTWGGSNGGSAPPRLMQIRHNLVVPEKPFFRRGRCVLKEAHHLHGRRMRRIFGMKRLRLGLAVGGMAVSAAACFALWPQARDAGAILAAQNDPAELSDLQLNSALRNNRAVIEQNIEAVLAANAADLANSFVEPAGAKNMSLPDELSRRAR